jgi:glycosyltransferase involved in cell wall biosynthesis
MLNLKEQLQLLLYRLFFWTSDCAVFVSERQRKQWRRQYVFARRNEVIYNGIDLEQWHPWGADEQRALRRALGFADEDFVIGMSAVLRPEKNPLQLVEAVAQLRSRGIPARALLIGDGPTRPEIEAHARRLGVAAHIAITGLQREVRPFVAACDTVVLCSFTEAFSLAAIEAMALGKPVVHSDVGGAAEMIRPGRNGFLFPVGDTAAFVERLAQLADRPLCERMGAKAREMVETHFTERSMIDRFEKTLVELVTARKKHANVRRTAGAH